MGRPETFEAVIPAKFTPEVVAKEPSNALFAAWQRSSIDQKNAGRDIMFQQSALYGIINRAVAAQTSPQIREAIQHYGKITEFFWFGNESMPLPHGLKRYLIADEKAPILSFDFDTLVGVNYSRIGEYVKEAGLDILLEYRSNLFKEQSGELLHPLARAIVANTPSYRLFESFNIDQTSENERPLSPVERLIQERLVEAAVRRRYGIPDNADVRMYPGANKEIGREIFRIDDETRPAKRRSSEARTPAERAINFFRELATNELEVSIQGSELVSITTAEKAKKLKIETDEESFFTDPETFVTYAESHDRLNSANLSYIRYVSAAIFSAIALRLFKEGDAPLNYGQILEEVMQKQTEELLADLGDFAAHNEPNSTYFYPLVTLLTNPVTANVEVDNYIVLVSPDSIIDWPNTVASRREYRKLDKKTKGRIKKRSFVDDDTIRIIQYENGLSELSDFSEHDADLVVEMPSLKGDLLPSIPGYQTTGYNSDKKLFGFRYLPEADSYAECPTIIPDEGRRALAEEYSNIGLNELATLVLGTPNMTVSQLAQDISHCNNYPLPKKSQTQTLPIDIAGYAKQVKNGRIAMQCVGASHFLKLSLKQVFGADAVGVIGGDSLPVYGNRITDMGHQQTTFTDPQTNRQYILDATPTSSDILLWRDMMAGYKANIKRTFRRTPPHPPRSAPARVQRTEEAEVAVSIVNSDEIRTTMLEQNKENLLLQLRMIYGAEGKPVDKDTLLEAVVKERQDDLVFRTLSVAYLATRSENFVEEAVRTLRFMEALRTCDDAAILKKVDPHQYHKQPRLLFALEDSLRVIIRLAGEEN